MFFRKKEDKETKKDLESTVKFSWGRVLKRGVQNMKDDVDPVYKGAKMGVYALHGIPTWYRECKDARLSNTSHKLAGLTALLVAGSSALAYYIGTKEALNIHNPEGYAVAAIPFVSTGLSYTREAFRRARRTELSNVVMSKIENTMKQEPTQTYDMTSKEVVAYIMKHDKKSEKEAKEEVMKRSSTHFTNLFADDEVGKTYEMTLNLNAGPMLRNEVNKTEEYRYSSRTKDYTEDGSIAKLVYDTVQKKGGSANIELLGQVTLVRNPNDDGNNTMYRVTPNYLWKK